MFSAGNGHVDLPDAARADRIRHLFASIFAEVLTRPAGAPNGNGPSTHMHSLTFLCIDIDIKISSNASYDG